MEKKAFQVVLVLMVITLGMLWRVKREEIAVGRGKESINVAGSSPAVKLTFLDVGQGDAAFIEWPDETQMLVDCGPDSAVLEGLGRVLSFYDRSIDYLVVTHPDLDHYGGCADVLTRYDISNIVYTGVQTSAPPWQYFWNEAQVEGAVYHQIEKEQTWDIASTSVRFLYPDHNFAKDLTVPGYAKSAKDNNGSIVIKLSWGDSDALLTGDAEKELEEYLVNTWGDQLAAEILKISHHGSGGSSITPFIVAVTPDHAVISVGADNDYGHPSLRVLRRLERAGAKIWRTDQQGDVRLRMFADRIEWK